MYIYITFSLSIHLLIDIWFASTPWLLKIIEQWISEYGYVNISSISCFDPYILTITLAKSSNFTVKKIVWKTIWTKLLKLPWPVINGTSWYHMLPERMQQKNHHLCDILAKNAYPKSRQEETSGNTEMRDVLWNNWPYCSKVSSSLIYISEELKIKRD